ncbi:4-alpha-glucanotransferase [Ectothiorhodosinus mongolicus]|uniref:4-alpha-glucanotransferase n=1 Tax=Ectothiorhodosinus mongolicus TaxID=233100 RepID=A0A1R3VR03_9GAMM|nr:4-alpha-glucanotransferase [Ectothiorhodosinus mongolicus]ULX57708.1 4-alpha-glucanotransferase [Ectothiorhodosinus mongolicus]SIT65562.1 4-alpha-glucanotransferase [Ectothiorhodosinus mongolicus]
MPASFGRRQAGVLLHPTSLPGPGLQGTLGKEAYRFIEFLQASGFGLWQVLPLNQPHGDRSPYQTMSVHAGNVGLVCPEALVEAGWLAPEDAWRGGDIDPLDARPWQRALQHFQTHADPSAHAAFADYKQRQAFWLDDYVLYLEKKGSYPIQGMGYDPDGKEAFRFAQFAFATQWQALRSYAHEKGVMLMGDMPIFVALDSADVWAHRDLFDLDEAGQPRYVTGVPPDYFAATGQRWGNPHYHWERMQEQGFSWWFERFAAILEQVDCLRIDHFRGFEACWYIPADEPTAMNGHWRATPGRALFEALQKRWGELPLVAEDLGIITPEVEALRDDFGLPGMKILQFAFDSDATNPYLPHRHIQNSVVYTGTHDNDTTLGWFEAADPELKQRALSYLGHPEEPMPWPLIRSALASVANTAILPMQDILALGSEHRMNQPGTVEGNWQWRFDWSQVSEDLAAKLKDMLVLYGRS